MPRQRRTIRRAHRPQLNAAAVEHFVAALEGDIAALRELDRALGLKPWQESPVYADTPEPPAWMTRQQSIADWRAAYALRRELEAAVSQ